MLVFTRFYQIDKSHSGKGFGLGLPIVKRIVELSRLNPEFFPTPVALRSF